MFCFSFFLLLTFGPSRWGLSAGPGTPSQLERGAGWNFSFDKCFSSVRGDLALYLLHDKFAIFHDVKHISQHSNLFCRYEEA